MYSSEYDVSMLQSTSDRPNLVNLVETGTLNY